MEGIPWHFTNQEYIPANLHSPSTKHERGEPESPWNKKYTINSSSPPGQNRRHFADDIFKCIFLNETFCVLIRISLKFVP